MSSDENRCDKIQPNNVITSENVVTPEVKILNRGDLLGAINCLFPELQLKSSHIKLKENFSLFSYSPKELTKIFESGRKYRSRTVKNIKVGNANQSVRSLRIDSSRKNSRRSNDKVAASTPSKNMLSASKHWKSKAQKKQLTHEMESSKRLETVQFQSNYTDFVAKFLDSYFPERFEDFKNIECVIQELHYLYKEISKEDKIGPFNPNLPVLNISTCDEALRKKSGSKDILISTNHKNIRKKKKSRSQIETKVKRRRSVVNAAPTLERIGELTEGDCDDENGNKIVQNIEGLLSNDTFSPRYKEKHTSEVFMIFRKSTNCSNDPDPSVFNTLEKQAIEQYENIDDVVDMNFNLLETEVENQYEI